MPQLEDVLDVQTPENLQRQAVHVEAADVVLTPRRSQRKRTPRKKNPEYSMGDELDQLLHYPKVKSPSERMKAQMKARYGR